MHKTVSKNNANVAGGGDFTGPLYMSRTPGCYY